MFQRCGRIFPKFCVTLSSGSLSSPQINNLTVLGSIVTGLFAFFVVIAVVSNNHNPFQWLCDERNYRSGDGNHGEAQPETAETAKIANELDESHCRRMAVDFVED